MSASQADGKKLLIFLSHASQDKAPVRELCARLRADGFDPWLDEERLLPGMNWDMEIEKALRASDAILLCFSELSVQKEGYIQREYKRAMRYQEEKPDGTIYVIPVRLDKCDLPYFIKDVQFVDFPDGYDRLVVSLRLRSGKLASAPPLPVKKEPEKPAVAQGSSSFQGGSGGFNIQGTNVSGVNLTAGGDQVAGNKTTTIYGGGEEKKADPLKEVFARTNQQIDRLPEDGDVDKSYLKMFVKDIERELTKGDGGNEKKLRNSFKMLKVNSEEIYASLVGSLQAPELDLPLEVRSLLD